MVCKKNNKNQQNNGAMHEEMKHKHFRSGCLPLLLDKETITTIKKSWSEPNREKYLWLWGLSEFHLKMCQIQKFTYFLGNTWPYFSSSDHIELLQMQNLHKTLMKNASNSEFQKTIEHIHCPQVSSWKFHLLTT